MRKRRQIRAYIGSHNNFLARDPYPAYMKNTVVGFDIWKKRLDERPYADFIRALQVELH